MATRNPNIPEEIKSGKPRDFIFNEDEYYVGSNAKPDECYHSTEIFFMNQAYCNKLLKKNTTRERIIKMQVFILRMRTHIDEMI